MINKLLTVIKEIFNTDISSIDFSSIDRNNPPIFGPEDIFEDIYDEDDTEDIIFIVVAFFTVFIAIVISFNIFFDCLRYIGII